MKSNTIHKIISFLLVVVFLTPLVISSFHHHEDEEHIFCDKNDVTHLHEKEIDNCSIYHYQLASVLLFTAPTLEKTTIDNTFNPIFNYVSFYSNNPNLLQLSRGPPYYVLAS